MRMDGAAAIEEMLSTDPHQQFIADGAAHLVSAPLIEVNGSSATVTCYQQVILRDPADSAYRTWRISANRWELDRTAEGWRIARRYNRPLDGGAEAKELFSAAFTN